MKSANTLVEVRSSNASRLHVDATTEIACKLCKTLLELVRLCRGCRSVQAGSITTTQSRAQMGKAPARSLRSEIASRTDLALQPGQAGRSRGIDLGSLAHPEGKSFSQQAVETLP